MSLPRHLIIRICLFDLVSARRIGKFGPGLVSMRRLLIIALVWRARGGGGKFAGIIRSLVNVYENVRVVLRNLCLIHNSIEGVDEIRNKEKKKLVRFNFDETWIAFRSDLDFFFFNFLPFGERYLLFNLLFCRNVTTCKELLLKFNLIKYTIKRKVRKSINVQK